MLSKLKEYFGKLFKLSVWPCFGVGLLASIGILPSIGSNA